MKPMRDLLAIEGGKPSRPTPIEPLYHIEQSTRDRVNKILDSGQFSGWYGGPVAREFEREFASRFGANHAIRAQTGSDAGKARDPAAGVHCLQEFRRRSHCY